VVLVTALFAWLTLPYFGAVLWGVVAAILFTPLYRKLAAMFRGRRNLAAGVTLIILLCLVIVPAILLAIALVQEATSIYLRIQAGNLDLAEVVGRLRAAMPGWLRDSVGGDFTDVDRLREMIGNALSAGARNIA